MDEKLKENYEIKKLTTFKIGGACKKAYFPKSIDSIVEIFSKRENALVLGGLSNVLVSSKGIEEDVVITTGLNNFEIKDNIVTADCGVKGPYLSQECQKRGLSGFEFMIGFPGTIGGMICMNASAHNQAIQDTFISCKVYDLKEKKIVELKKEDLKFSYRKSVITEKNYILLSAKFELKMTDKEKIDELMQRNLEFRKQRQPSLVLPNCGSIFKNPTNDSAGRLLDLAGAKGLSIGGAKVWDDHANFIINYDNADSKDVLNLMYKMYNMVKEKYTIELTPELKFIGIKEAEEEKIWQTMTGENTVLTQK